jgi:hypothetical protein
VEETLRDERHHGYLQSKEVFQIMEVWMHWGGDAAGFLRGLKHSLFGFKMIGNGRVCFQAPSNMRQILLFESKDNYENYKEYMGPFLPMMTELQEEGIILTGCTLRSSRQWEQITCS